ncbi:hypothetical protein ROJ8625_03479 [Roseivivax jejudonensis]|uniref:Uncharacterized protein n=1 Tax=Roseivivax jejudonensis TaxID=1529041 RepID=A0A1X7A180_9RHOB|nr:hypothetical protein [Roseivivax jejudonensis]SLN67719.1 hypothetical protein ROJ8625_03479 [Roseivivax jejudonensis]
MTITRILALAAGTALVPAGAALAQSDDGAPRNAMDVTCAEFLVLDTPEQGEILMPIMPSMQGASGQSESGNDSAATDPEIGTSDTSASDLGASDRTEGDGAEMTEDPEIGSSDTTASDLGATDDATNGASDTSETSGSTASDMSGTAETGASTSADTSGAAETGGSATASASGAMDGGDTGNREASGEPMVALVTGVFEVCAMDSEASVQDAMDQSSEAARGGPIATMTDDPAMNDTEDGTATDN